MDKLSGLASKLGGKGQSHQQGGSSGGGSSNNQEDYVDKGLDSVEKKYGADPSKLRGTNEKITDAGRQQFESRTGKHVPDKISN
ncbi:uncharacterized protein EURHEDRAFT_381680 [Aspergillus ruber CBS 135680]|uniref:Uncharacterized protein n=1 Tax=Aspergillus ruber (strain CBS 135680) TaxID=1388766 RepID=A0A017S177_ASPRC|nr:uncharacterized protein EURHEDRAFT_381680 [Aspergillus ruber CBS 135680]EYE90808.1 hypothetical protein EURHEDRAFT_381680 [Aspergillus ruber CBS 135680]